MTYLPDVNVWIALTSNRHVHHRIATAWLQSIHQDAIAFCRITELGFLRLLTNTHVMGSDVLSPALAWQVYDQWRMDDRVVFLSERADFAEHWRRVGERITGATNAWTDAYLAAFAAHAGAIIVTFDRMFCPLGEVTVKSLI